MKDNYLRNALGSLLLFLALNAMGGGWYGLGGAKEIPPEWLENSPFTDYFIPSLFLFVVMGGSFLFGAFAVFRSKPFARKMALGCGALLLLWIAAQVWFIGFVSWLQPAMAGAGMLILLFAALMPQKPAAGAA